VIAQISKQVAGDRALVERFASAPLMLGLLAGIAVMYATGMLVG
jgi:hypothetical protein